MESIMVGCPIAKRAWIFPKWVEHIERACGVAGVIPNYVFVMSPSDEEMLNCVVKEMDGKQWNLYLITEDVEKAKRDWWRRERIEHMVEIRNDLLSLVNLQNPLLFWSCDSDMLAAPDSLKKAIEALLANSYAAVGMRTFMTPVGTDCASKANLIGDRLTDRFDEPGTFGVQVIMGSKLMAQAAYNVRYEYDVNGEDIGWSNAVRRAGGTLGWTGSASCKHVMSPEMLDKIDPRVGF